MAINFRLGANQAPVKQTASILNQSAAKYGVPPSVLFGVWGMETNFGQNVKTSSAGAVGDFQFLPSTAREYGYPLTNTPNWTQFTQQSDATARYLSTLFKQTGSWDAALKAYSGGGYGLAQVQGKAGAGPGNDLGGLSTPGLSSINPLGGVQPNVDLNAPTPGDIAGAITSVWNTATSGTFWKRVLYFVGGAVLLFWGIKELTGAHIPEGVKGAAMAAAV